MVSLGYHYAAYALFGNGKTQNIIQDFVYLTVLGHARGHRKIMKPILESLHNRIVMKGNDIFYHLAKRHKLFIMHNAKFFTISGLHNTSSRTKLQNCDT